MVRSLATLKSLVKKDFIAWAGKCPCTDEYETDPDNYFLKADNVEMTRDEHVEIKNWLDRCAEVNKWL